MTWVAVSALVPLLWTASATCQSRVKFGGAHVAYGLGGGVGDPTTRFRHGLDFAVMPVFIYEHGSSHYFENYEGYLFGFAGMWGFGDSPSFVGPEFAYGTSSIIGFLVGGGPTYRIPEDNMGAGYGASGRIAVDILLIQGGFRLTAFTGNGTTEGIATVSLGIGRF